MIAQLALKRGGKAIDNPRDWYDSLPQETIDYWQAVYDVSPFGDEWRQTAQISHLLWKVFSSNVTFDGEPPIVEVDNFMPDGYVPPPGRKPQTNGITDPIEQQQELCRYFNIPFTG